MAIKILNGLDLDGQRIVSVGDPVAAQDAATKNYVDTVVRGLDWKQSVRAATAGPLSLAAPGGSIDGVVLRNGDRVLVKDQVMLSENGIYMFNGALSPMTRTSDADGTPNADLTSGAAVTSTEGGTNGDKTWVLTTDDPIVVGATGLVFTQLGGTGTGGGGTIWFTGDGPPGDVAGANPGDLYLDNITGDYYRLA